MFTPFFSFLLPGSLEANVKFGFIDYIDTYASNVYAFSFFGHLNGCFYTIFLFNFEIK